MSIRINHREGTASPRRRSAGAIVRRTKPPVSPGAAPDPADVARLAYSYWESRGGNGGSAEEDWLRAEQELRQRLPVSNI